MKTKILAVRDLPQDLVEAWVRAHAANPELRSPCFRPELFRAVANHFDDVYVGLLDDGTQRGFLPFLRASGRMPSALPVPLCDYQAVIAPAPGRWDVREFLAEGRLLTWEFEHLVGADHMTCAPAWMEARQSPRICLDQGLEGYWADLQARNVSLKNLLNKRRLAERDHGPLRLVSHVSDASVLTSLLKWKEERFNAGQPMPRGVRGVLEQLIDESSPDFTALLSGLYAGDALVAAHFGIRSQGVMHYWFPAFNPAFGKYTPGWLLVYELIRNAGALGYDVLDFGPGGEAYKWYFNNRTIPIAHGAFELRTFRTMARSARRDLLTAVRKSKWIYDGLAPIRRMIRKG